MVKQPVDLGLKTVDPRPGEKLSHKLIRWHHSLAGACGTISLRLTRTAIKKSELRQIERIVSECSKEMKQVVKEMTE